MRKKISVLLLPIAPVFLDFFNFPKKSSETLYRQGGDYFFWVTQRYIWDMFVRMKRNKSGVVSVQILEKRSGKSVLVKTIGSSGDDKQVADLLEQGKQ